MESKRHKNWKLKPNGIKSIYISRSVTEREACEARTMAEGLRLFCNKVSRVRLTVRNWYSTGSETLSTLACRLSALREEPSPISWTGGLGGKYGARTGLALTL